MAEDERVDVLVVGGGPAGLSAATAAAAAGGRVLLVERRAEIGSPVRTSGASWLADAAELGIPPSLVHPVPTVRFVAPRREAAWTFDPPRLCVLDVRGVYQHLAAEAARAGASLRLRTSAVEPLLDAGRVAGALVRDDRGRSARIRAVVTIDASGVSSELVQGAGLGGRPRRLGVGVEQELVAPDYDQCQAVLLVGRDVAPRGYAWAFPRGDGRVRVGVGVLRPDTDLDPAALLDRLRQHPALAPSLRNAQPLEHHVGVLPAEAPRARLSTAGLLLAGDAAGQASPLVGEGIRYAIRAGRLAGAVAVAAVRSNDPSAAALRRYDRAWRRRFGAEMAVATWVHRRAARYGDRNWRVVTALLGALGPGQVAAALHGDFTPAWWLGLSLASPRLVLAAASALRQG